jgi:hypothetical protein
MIAVMMLTIQHALNMGNQIRIVVLDRPRLKIILVNDEC